MRGDDINHELEAEGIPDLEEDLIPPRDYPQGVEEFGVTAAEQQVGESVADRVQREEPEDVLFQAEEVLPGRLVEPGSGVDELDEEKDLVATLLEGDSGGLSAEESAMHLVEEE